MRGRPPTARTSADARRRTRPRRVHAKIALLRAARALICHPAPPRLSSHDTGRATTKIRTMDIERINAIGNHIADLSERTIALRGYL